jgi:serine phosphatase RsbU (regulator of sigma subunit)/PAS domain-containing protein
MRIWLTIIYATLYLVNFAQVKSQLIPFHATFEKEDLNKLPLDFKKDAVGKVLWQEVPMKGIQKVTTTNYNVLLSENIPFYLIDTNTFTPVISTLKKPTLLKRTGFKLPDFRSVNLKYLNITCGIPSNEILDMDQDEDGNIWVLSSEGIFKITGSYILHYTYQHLLPDANLEKIICFQNKIYIATFGQGLWVLEDEKLSKYTKELGFFSDHIINFDRQENQLIINYYGNGWIELSKDGKFIHYVPESSADGVLLTSKQTHLGRFFLSDKGSAYIQSPSENHFKKVSFSSLSWLSNSRMVAHKDFFYVLIPKKGIVFVKENSASLMESEFLKTVETLYMGKSGICWGFSPNGIVLLNEDKIYRIYTNESFLSGSKILNCFQDDVANLWISTANRGIGFLSPSNFSVAENLSGSISLRTIYTNNGNTYSEAAGGGLQREEKNGSVFEFKHSKLTNIVGMANYNESIYIATLSGLFVIENNTCYEITFLKDRGYNSHTNITSTKSGVYISNYNYGVLHFDGNKFWAFTNFSTEINQIIEDTLTQKIWIANADKGLSYIYNDHVFHTSTSNGFISNKVFSIAVGKEGQLFAGTSTGLITLVNNQFYHFPSIDFIQGKVTSCLYVPARNELWVNTSAQLFKIQIEKNYQLTRYNQNEIPAFGNIPHNGIFLAGEDVLFIMDNHVVRYMDYIFGYQKKELVIDLVSIRTRNTQSNLQQEFTQDDLTHYITPSSHWNFQLNAGYYDLNFILDVKNFGKEEGLVYYYRLNGWSEYWEGPVKNDVINFSNLPPGDYSLFIKAETTDEILVKPLQISFQIQSFFYQTTWFAIIVILIVSLLILLLLKTYTSFDFRNFESYTSLREVIIKLRLLAIFSLVLLPFFDFMSSMFFELYPFNGAFLLVVILISLLALTLSFVSGITQKQAANFLMIAFTIVLSVYITRAHSTSFPVAISIQTIVILLFARLIFSELKFFIYFIIVLLLIHSFNALYFNVYYNENSLLYFWSLFQTTLLLLALYLVDVNAKRSVLFANKILESTELFVLVCDAKGKLIYCNDYLKNTTQQKESDLLGFGWWKYRGYDVDRLNETIKQVEELIQTESTANYVNTLFINNELMYVEWNDYVLEGRYLIGVGKNITEKHLLRLQNERLSLVAKSVTNGVLITNSAYSIEWCNIGFETIFETTLAHIYHANAEHILQSNEENSNLSYEIKYSAPSGDVKWLLINKSSSINERDEIEYIYVITNITVRKNLELKLLDYAEDLEINNLLKEQLIYSTDFEELARLSLSNLVEKLPNVKRSTLLLLNANKREFNVFSLQDNELSRNILAVEDIKGYELLLKKEIYIQYDLNQLEKTELSESDRSLLESRNIIAYIEVPIIINNELAGAIIVGFDIPYPFETRQENILKSYARLLSVATQKIRIQEDLANKNKDITDSLFYAKNIQNSLLPNLEEVRPFFKDLFVYYQPKDIVSGDFYWIEKVNNQLILVVGDCTGHGVPGAFITLLGQNLLNQFISEHKEVNPVEVIQFINNRTFQALNKGKDTYIKDGMELAVCVFNTLTKEFTYAGVGVELTYYQENQRFTIDAPRFMVGELNTLPSTSVHTMKIEATTKFYISTDGYRDQLGGNPRKRFSKPTYLATLDEFKNLPLFQQPFLLNHKLQQHRGQHEQTDDILIVGFEL